MFSRIASWPREKRLNAGVWCSPLLMWGLYALQILLLYCFDRQIDRQIDRLFSSVWGVGFVVVATCIFWLACAAFSGLCAALFWCDLDLDAQIMATLTFRSVAISWAPTLLNCCAWVILWIPFLIYLSVFRYAVDRGLKFWKSNHPREWVGDFSNPDNPDED